MANRILEEIFLSVDNLLSRSKNLSMHFSSGKNFGRWSAGTFLNFASVSDKLSSSFCPTVVSSLQRHSRLSSSGVATSKSKRFYNLVVFNVNI